MQQSRKNTLNTQGLGTVFRFMFWKGVRLYEIFRLDKKGVLPNTPNANCESFALARIVS